MTRVRGRMGGKGKSYEEQVEEVGFTQGNIYRYILYVVPMYMYICTLYQVHGTRKGK